MLDKDSDEQLVKDELSSLPFYHGYIDSTEAVEILQNLRPGTFLLRRSKQAHHAGACVISVIKTRTPTRTDIYHFTVMRSEGNYYAQRSMHFNSMRDLLAYYKTHDYENHLGISGVRLLYPIEAPNAAYAYATVQGIFTNRLNHLLMVDETQCEICECGISLKDSELPNGWAIHQTSDKPPRIFFQHIENDLTQWDLPTSIRQLLTPAQKKFIRDKLVH